MLLLSSLDQITAIVFHKASLSIKEINFVQRIQNTAASLVYEAISGYCFYFYLDVLLL